MQAAYAAAAAAARAALIQAAGASVNGGVTSATTFAGAACATAAQRRSKSTAAADGGDGTLERLHAHFGRQYGARWPALWEAMSARSRNVAWGNPFLPPDRLAAAAPPGWARVYPGLPVFAPPPEDGNALAAAVEKPAAAQWREVDGVSGSAADAAAYGGGDDAAESEQGAAAAPPPRGRLRAAYLLDRASLLPPLALAPRPGDRVLDACAAPGGKALVLAALLFGAAPRTDAGADHEGSGGGGAERRRGSLVCNERSRARRVALAGVLRAYLPGALLAGDAAGGAAVTVTGRDAARWPYPDGGGGGGMFDRILLDAPCSSERHLAQRVAAAAAAAAGGGSGSGARALSRADWSPSRSKRNAATQLALLLSTLRLLAPGGRLVYATCSVAAAENDGVVASALKRAGGGVRAAPEAMRWPELLLKGSGSGANGAAAAVEFGVEATEHGLIALPDRAAGGCGPLYWAVLEKDPSC